ncbi:MAG TPA: TMEM175 family protein [Chthoniobacterales bacterium]|nr:TMEM175 family protein [Chthoniobacterales bacterium]
MRNPSFAALAMLWPTALSYAVSYLFIAIIWVNHHYLLRLAEGTTPQLIWWNFAHLFLVSLIPFSTAWIATSRMAAVPVFVYAAIFVLVNIAYLAFECEALSTAETRGVSIRVRKIRRARSILTLAIFLGSMLISLRFPLCGFGLVCCVVFAYLRPEPPNVDVAEARHARDTTQKTDAIL